MLLFTNNKIFNFTPPVQKNVVYGGLRGIDGK
jgi:hypothetical protein